MCVLQLQVNRQYLETGQSAGRRRRTSPPGPRAYCPSPRYQGPISHALSSSAERWARPMCALSTLRTFVLGSRFCVRVCVRACMRVCVRARDTSVQCVWVTSAFSVSGNVARDASVPLRHQVSLLHEPQIIHSTSPLSGWCWTTLDHVKRGRSNAPNTDVISGSVRAPRDTSEPGATRTKALELLLWRTDNRA